ncbi:MAG: hypothetical protein R3E39_15790 [Anaerolineae bacterium]
MKIRILLLIIAMMTGLAACNRGNVTDIERGAEGGVDVTVKLTEQEVNDSITNAFTVGANPLLRNPVVELQSGKIVVNGEHDRLNGSGRVSGSITITVTIQNGTILAQISQADIEGFDLNDARVAEFNQRLQADFTRRANRDNKELTFKTVTITDSDIEIIFNVKRS